MQNRLAPAVSRRPPRRALPAHSCDCHVHVFDPARFPWDGARRYTPPAATVADLRAFAQALGITRVVLVQPSVYGTDNRCLLDALRQWGSGHARGVAVVDAAKLRTTDLAALHAAGVRAVRFNCAVQGQYEVALARRQIAQTLQVLPDYGWSLQIHAELALVDALADSLAQANIPVVLDHFARLQADQPTTQPGFAALLSLLASRHVWVKLSAPYHTARGPHCTDALTRQLTPFVQQLLTTAPDRLLWGSDWPHTGGTARGTPTQIEPLRPFDDAAALDALHHWAGAALYQKILVDNPAQLYGFAT